MTDQSIGKKGMPPHDLSMLQAFSGLNDAASRIESALPEGWGEKIDISSLLASASNNALISGGDRWVGMRTIWTAEDPAVRAFTAQLFGMLSVIPEPDQAIIDQFANHPSFEREGNIIAVDGVPVPAGKEQVRVFVNLRWRWLINPLASLHLVALRNAGLVDARDHAELMVEQGHQPHLRHFLGYDAVHTTDEAQQKYLAYSMAAHRANLIVLQQHDLELFMAVWLRDFAKIKSLVSGKKLSYLLEADKRTRRMQKASRRLIYGTAIMSEFERLFEIADCFSMDGGVTREAIERVLRSVSSIEEIHAGTTPAHKFLSGSIAHTRSLHPTMNGYVRNISSDPALNKANAAFKETSTYWTSSQRLKKPSGEVPALYFLGIEPQFLTAAAIMMMIRNVRKLEKNFNYRDSGSGDFDERSEGPIFRLAVVIMANSCVPTALGMTKALGRDFKVSKFDGEAWLEQTMPTLMSNPALTASYEAAQSAYENSPAGLAKPPISYREFADEENKSMFSSQFAGAKVRADACPDVDQAGWTRGFHFEAWFKPNAEYNFLRKCCRFVQFSADGQHRREKWSRSGKPKGNLKYTGSSRTTFTGLPRSHPVENVHHNFRPFFERLQFADGLNEDRTISERAAIDTFVAEVARLMPGISPVTVDPHMNEAIVYPLETVNRKFAAEAAWNL